MNEVTNIYKGATAVAEASTYDGAFGTTYFIKDWVNAATPDTIKAPVDNALKYATRPEMGISDPAAFKEMMDSIPLYTDKLNYMKKLENNPRWKTKNPSFTGFNKVFELENKK